LPVVALEPSCGVTMISVICVSTSASACAAQDLSPHPNPTYPACSSGALQCVPSNAMRCCCHKQTLGGGARVAPWAPRRARLPWAQRRPSNEQEPSMHALLCCRQPRAQWRRTRRVACKGCLRAAPGAKRPRRLPGRRRMSPLTRRGRRQGRRGGAQRGGAAAPTGRQGAGARARGRPSSRTACGR